MASLSSAYEECRVLNRHYGTRFFHAISLFPKALQPHIHGLCAFDRILLEMIRNPKEGVKKKDQLDAMKAWQRAFEAGMNDSLISNTYIMAAIHTTKIFDIDPKLFTKIVKARMDDHKKTSYGSYLQLKNHLDSTAGRVSDILCNILQITDYRAKKQALRLARAGELIELVSDAGIAIKRGKCYFPAIDLKRFRCSTDSIKKNKVTKSWQRLAEHYLKKAESDIAAGLKNLNHYPASTQDAFQTIGDSYQSLIDDIRQKDYNVFTRQPKLGWKLKLKHYIPALGSLVN